MCVLHVYQVLGIMSRRTNFTCIHAAAALLHVCTEFRCKFLIQHAPTKYFLHAGMIKVVGVVVLSAFLLGESSIFTVR